MVAADDDGDVSRGRLVDIKALSVEGRLQRLQTDHILQFEISHCGFTRAELMNELPETEPNPLPGHKVLILNVPSHVLGKERLITAKERQGLLK